jgi:hypothetical protein
MFDLIVHADWSVNTAKRWVAIATKEGERWHLSDAEPARGLADRLLNAAKHERVLAGFDFPIGVPAHWAKKAGIETFQSMLPLLGSGEWARFFDVAEHAADISAYRPFYPRVSSASAKQAHLLRAMDADSIDQLRRRCERATTDRRAACALFWTLGGNQVGKAALSGWREVIIPAVRQGAHLWPFDGDIADRRTKGLTIAETYPAEAYKHVGVIFRPGMSKRRQSDRAAFAGTIDAWASKQSVALSPELVISLGDGFGASAEGEDRFDALIGLCGMIEVIVGRQPQGAPADPQVRGFEGWIFGQSA